MGPGPADSPVEIHQPMKHYWEASRAPEPLDARRYQRSGRAVSGYGTKTRPLGVTGPMIVTWPMAPVVRSIVPREFAGKPGAGQVDGALLALHGVTEVNTVPGVKAPVSASTVFAEESVVNRDPVAAVAQAMSSTELEIFRTCKFLPPAAEKISSSSPWELSTKSPANADELEGTTALESGSVS